MNAQSGVCTPAGGLVTGRDPDPAVGCSAGPRAQHPLPPGHRGPRGSGAPHPLQAPWSCSRWRTSPHSSTTSPKRRWPPSSSRLWSPCLMLGSSGRSGGLRVRARARGGRSSGAIRLCLRSRRCPGGPCGTRTRRSRAWVVSCRAGPRASLRDVPALLLGGPVRHRGRGAGLRDSSALLHCQAFNKGGLHTSPWMQQGQPGSPGSWELGGDSPRASGFGVRGDSLPPPSSPVSPACRRRSTGTPFKDHEERSIPGAESRRGRHCCPCSC